MGKYPGKTMGKLWGNIPSGCFFMVKLWENILVGLPNWLDG
jgi:hypothetical protein